MSRALSHLFLLGAVLAGPAVARAENKIEVSSAVLRGHVNFLTSLGFRNHRDPAAMRWSAAYISGKLRSYGLATESQKYEFEGKTYENVVATINPDKKRVIVVGAHYDVFDKQPGADDNASGVAGLIETARLAAANRGRIPYQVQFVAYANEEPPFFKTEGMGSFQHAKRLAAAKTEVEFMMSLEMIGYFSDAKGSQGYPARRYGWFRPKKGNYIALISKRGSGKILRRIRKSFERSTRLPVETMAAPLSIKGVDFSDHASYWKFGWPAVMVTDTAFYRNPNYHKPGDVAETLDYVRMADVVNGVAAALVW